MTLERCLFSKITTTMWSGRSPAVLGLVGADRNFFGAARRAAVFGSLGAGRRTLAFNFLGMGGATAAGVLRADGAVAPIFFGAAGMPVEELWDGLGIAVDDGSTAVQAVDASSKIPAMLKPVHRGEPRTWNSPLDSKYSELFIQRVNASNRKTWACDAVTSLPDGRPAEMDYRQPMDGFIIDRSDGRDDGEDWTESYEELPGSANVSIILESTTKAGVGPRLHKHPYAETFIIRRGWATFTIGSTELQGRAGQVLVVPANTPHKFSTGRDGYEAVHIHANPRFVTEWLE
jgi:mannose-6-phosphate isomerase-like protein (cupin superfamily)